MQEPFPNSGCVGVLATILETLFCSVGYSSRSSQEQGPWCRQAPHKHAISGSPVLVVAGMLLTDSDLTASCVNLKLLERPG